MKRLILCILSLGPMNLGCSLVQSTARNMINEPCRTTERAFEHHRNRIWARHAFEEVAKTLPEQYSKDYARGFQDGYVDYLQSGGTGEAPSIPPRDYWKPRYQNAAGQEAIQDWFRGFEHGAAEAIVSGRRHEIVVPVYVKPGRDTSGSAMLTVPSEVHLPTHPEGAPVLPLPRMTSDPSPQKPLERSAPSSGTQATPSSK